MVRSGGLWRAVLRRSRSDWPVVFAAWLLLLSGTTLLATGALYGETVAAGGMRRALLDGPPASRAIVVQTRAAGAGAVAELEAPIASAVRDAISLTGGEVATVLRSGSFAEADVPAEQIERLTVLAAHDALSGHAQLVAGRWPAGGTAEATLSEPAAAAFGVGVGDRLPLVSRLDEDVRVEVSIVGLWRPDPADPYWSADPLDVAGVQPADPYTTVGPIVVGRDLLLGLPGRIEVQWRAIPAIEHLAVDSLAAFAGSINLLDERIRDAVPGARQVAVNAPLPDRLADVERSVVVSRSGVTLLTIQFAVLAGYAVVLVGGLLLERRRAESALLRSRGASTGHLLAMAVVEGLVLAGLAAGLAPVLAVGVVRGLVAAGPLREAGIAADPAVSGPVVLAALGAGLAGVVALALPTLTGTVSLAGVRAAIGRQTGRTLPQRLGVDLALVAVAAVALWQLRLYGAPLTSNSRGVLGVDPLLVAAPAIGLLAGAVLALRIVPRLAELAERVLGRRRGLVGPLGGRQLARRPLRYTRSALLLVLAAGLGTFACAHAATWTRSQQDQGAYRAAADVRVVPAGQDEPLAAAGASLRATEGVALAMPVGRHTLDLGRNVRGAPLLALEPPTARRMLGLPEATGRQIGAALDALAARPRPGAGVPIPGEPARLSLVVDAALERLPADEPYAGALPRDHPGIVPAVVVEDAHGRLHRVAGEAGVVQGSGQRLPIPLLVTGEDGTTAAPTYPLSLVAVELTLSVPPGVMAGGTVDLVEVAAGDERDGDVWTEIPVDVAAGPWRWLRTTGGAPGAYAPPKGQPGRLEVGARPGGPPPLLPEERPTFRLLGLPDAARPIPVIVGRRFADLTSLAAGEEATATVSGIRLPLRIEAVVDEFPPLDPGQPFVVLDAASLERARFVATGQTPVADEWWIDARPGREAAVAAALAAGPEPAELVVDRVGLTRELSTDPVSLGVIGALGLGALAAVALASIGFLVSAAVSAAERVGEFALLRALGLSGRQLAVWLSIESATLLGVGLLAGTGLGVLLAWLVLPSATLTETGAPAVPAPVVVVPWASILPAWGLALVLLVATVVVMRRQLPSVDVSGVLRARDE